MPRRRSYQRDGEGQHHMPFSSRERFNSTHFPMLPFCGPWHSFCFWQSHRPQPRVMLANMACALYSHQCAISLFPRVTNSSDMFRSAIEGTAVLRTCCSKVVSTRRHRNISNLAESVHQRSSLSLSFRIILEQHKLGRTPTGLCWPASALHVSAQQCIVQAQTPGMRTQKIPRSGSHQQQGFNGAVRLRPGNLGESKHSTCCGPDASSD